MPDREKLSEFVAWTHKHTSGDEKGRRRHPEFRIRKADEDDGGTAFADHVWKPVVLIEMKKRGENLQKRPA